MHDALQPWRAAATFQELCSLASQFLWGELPHFPGWRAPDVDEETDAILDELDLLCRSGFLPLASQPGHPQQREHDGRLWSRRAFVTGVAAAPWVSRLAQLAPPHWSLKTWPMSEAANGRREPVGLRGGVPYLWAGEARGPEELAVFREEVSPAALDELQARCYVSLIDEIWGRGKSLFAEIDQRLRHELDPPWG